MKQNNKDGAIRTIIKAADSLSLGISIVVAVLIGFGIGYFLKYLTNSNWWLGVGLGLGVLAAINNVYIAYKKLVKSYEEESQDNEKG